MGGGDQTNLLDWKVGEALLKDHVLVHLETGADKFRILVCLILPKLFKMLNKYLFGLILVNFGKFC